MTGNLIESEAREGTLAAITAAWTRTSDTHQRHTTLSAVHCESKPPGQATRLASALRGARLVSLRALRTVRGRRLRRRGAWRLLRSTAAIVLTAITRWRRTARRPGTSASTRGRAQEGRVALGPNRAHALTLRSATPHTRTVRTPEPPQRGFPRARLRAAVRFPNRRPTTTILTFSVS